MTIETPVQKKKVELREWITAKQAGWVNEPMYAMTAKPTNLGAGVDMGEMPLTAVMEMKKRETEAFVISIDGVTEKLPDLLMELHEEDYQFIQDTVADLRKKKSSSTVM